ncbi:MAG TPA: hypothetical protein DD400_02340 [Rhodospirillaceae bacterium]|nr:hypothetical protein [Rhodospirillaceae bacterium]
MKNRKIRATGINSVVLVLMLLFISCVGTDGSVQKAWAGGEVDLGEEDVEIQECVKVMLETKVAYIRDKTHGAADDFNSGTMQASEQKKVLGDIGDRYCFELYETVFSMLVSLTDIYGIVTALVKVILEAMLSFVCDFVVSVINNVLNSICLPLPSISIPGFGLDGWDTKYCNGLSAGDFMGARRRPVFVPFTPDLPTSRELLRQVPVIREFE